MGDPANTPGRVHDCEVLLKVKDELSESETLNWSEHLPIEKWVGVDTDSLRGSPPRVSRLYLDRLGPDGYLPNGLIKLTALNALYVQDYDTVGPRSSGNLASCLTQHDCPLRQ